MSLNKHVYVIQALLFTLYTITFTDNLHFKSIKTSGTEDKVVEAQRFLISLKRH